MKKNTVILLVISGVIIIAASWIISSHNGLVNKDQNVKKEWSNVQSQYQRRADLIPNLVATVKGYATHEKETLEGVVAARAKATQITVDPKNLSPEKIQQYQAAQGELGSALGKLIMLKESYPDLKANQNFKDLQVELAGTENRINTARVSFTNTVNEYNNSVLYFPSSVIAKLFGFKEKNYFEAEKGAEKVPEVKF